MNQLWRNMLIAEQTAAVRKYDAFHFWVVSPRQNEWLWKEHGKQVEDGFRSILTPKGNQAFKRLDIENDVVSPLEGLSNNAASDTRLKKFREKYLFGI